MTPQQVHFYTKLTEFLGRALGPDYEVAFHDLTDSNRSLVAISNNHISGRDIGAPLTNVALKIIADRSYQTSDYRTHYRGMSIDGRILRCSTMFIKDANNELVGLLCINFDDSRYQELSEKILELCHPDVFVESNFLFDSDRVPLRPSTEDTESFHNSIDDVAGNAVGDVLRDMGVTAERLTHEEKMAVVGKLDARGVFLLKGAVRDVARALCCSPASVYRYLSKLRNEP